MGTCFALVGFTPFLGLTVGGTERNNRKVKKEQDLKLANIQCRNSKIKIISLLFYDDGNTTTPLLDFKVGEKR